MDRDELISKMQFFAYALRRRRWEQVFATLTLALFAFGVYLKEAWKQLAPAAYLAYAAYALGVAFAIWLAVRIWKQAALPPLPPDVPVSSAVKGLLPFTSSDGKLFARLGRRNEVQILLSHAQDTQVAITVVRGQSGAGKTSLLQAGLAFRLGDNQSVYWEAVPTSAPTALLHALRAQFPQVDDLDSLPAEFPERCVLILDQFEQLSPKEPEHAPIFDLLERIAKSPAPHKLTAVVGFRREFLADWMDFEQSNGFMAGQIPINLLATSTASDALITLAGEAGLTLDNALVTNFINEVKTPDGISPVDVAIGILSLANFAQRQGQTHIGMAEYRLAGEAEGLLFSFVEQKLEEIPQPVRAPLLKGIVLSLVDLAKNQRVAEGASVEAIASQAQVAPATLLPWLERLAHPRIRLLEKPAPDRFRLPHERLIPVLRRLTGTVLASLDQLNLLFEDGFARWFETHSSRSLLRGKELREVVRKGDYFLQGENATQKAEYLRSCLRRRNLLRWAAGAAFVVVVVIGYAAAGFWHRSIQLQELSSWRMPTDLLKEQKDIDSLEVTGGAINDLTWLHSARLKELKLSFDGSSLAGLDKLTGLHSLTLYLEDSRTTSLTPMEKLTGLNSLIVRLRGSQVPSLAPLEKLTSLNSLDLDLGGSQITNLAPLEKLTGLTSLTFELYRSPDTSLAPLEKLTGLNSLTLYIRDSPGISLVPLEKLSGLNSLTLYLGDSPGTSLAPLGNLPGLTSLTFNPDHSQIAGLAGLEKLTRLTTLTLDLDDSQTSSLAGLEKLTGLTRLTLNLNRSHVTSLAPLEKLPRLNSLTLAPDRSQVASLAGLEKLSRLTTLTLDLEGSRIDKSCRAGEARRAKLAHPQSAGFPGHKS